MQKETKLIIVIFVVAMLLRLSLGIVNRAANDNHVDVVSWIVDKHQIPEAPNCWSCYQPKLYYLMSAAIMILFDVQLIDDRILVMQLLNICLSFFLLLFFWKFMKRQSLSSQNKVLLFAFFSFNPCLIGINVQSTNDTMVILSGVVAVYYADLFFAEMNWKDGMALILALIAGSLTKGSGMILWIVISAVFILKILASKSKIMKLQFVKYFSIFMISYLSIVPVAGSYVTNYVKYHNLTLSTWGKNPPPHFFEITPVDRAGVQSDFTAYFTFRYFDMIRQPFINNENENYPLHRTSLWSQLYGRTMFMHFDQWPPQWQSQYKFIITVGQILIVLGIIPLFLFLLGLFYGAFNFIKNVIGDCRSYLSTTNEYLHVVITIAFLLSSVIYSYNYRDFSSMKSIYIFPGLISYIKLSSDGLALLKSKIPVNTIKLILMVIVIFSIVDIVFLFWQLKKLHYGTN